MRTRVILLAVLLIAIPELAQSEDKLSTAQQRIGLFQKSLMEELKQGLIHGPAHAITICRHRAPQIAAELSNNRVKIGRTSDRLRNPLNDGPEWTKPYLNYFKNHPQSTETQATHLSDGKQGFVKPIYIQRPCLNCHGKKISPEVAETLQSHYPQDQAVGYDLGGFRGIFWVEIR
ncbi:DUF3365 domain-containing protein [uncultured Desulfuromonas sp.]|uniref:Tll0287-like domain-containing protein n=1 Tax=uncultured Desulfuromonas sp. TaxID=181013 RepID=UPI002AABFE66|nr:DUF3365 domain-containing protein [uncultured Desulfuromonas sp.]